MATGLGDQMAAPSDGQAACGHHAPDREQAIDTLKAAFVQGRLTRDELDELAALTDDLPAGLTPVAPP